MLLSGIWKVTTTSSTTCCPLKRSKRRRSRRLTRRTRKLTKSKSGTSGRPSKHGRRPRAQGSFRRRSKVAHLRKVRARGFASPTTLTVVTKLKLVNAVRKVTTCVPPKGAEASTHTTVATTGSDMWMAHQKGHRRRRLSLPILAWKPQTLLIDLGRIR